MADEDVMITIEFDDGTSMDCYVMGTFDYNEQTYIALEPDDDTEDIYIYQYTQSGDDFILEEIEDEDEFEIVSSVLDTLWIDDDEDSGEDTEGEDEEDDEK